MQPEPSGERWIPPHILTAIGTAEDGQRVVGLALSGEREETLLARAFQAMDWNVEFGVDAHLIALGMRRELQLVISDNLFVIGEFAQESHEGKTPHMLYVAADDFDEFDHAWNSGADGVMLRDVDTDSIFTYAVVMKDDA